MEKKSLLVEIFLSVRQFHFLISGLPLGSQQEVLPYESLFLTLGENLNF